MITLQPSPARPAPGVRRGLLVLGLIALLSQGWGRAADPVARHSGGILRLALEADPRSLDAGQVFSNEEGTVGFLLFNTLLEAGPEGGFVPVLAEGLPEGSADGLAYRFRLKQGVRFANGQELEAADVVHSLERCFDPEAAAVNLAYFTSILGGLEFLEARKKELATPRRPGHDPGPSRWIEPRRVEGLRAVDTRTVEIRLSRRDLGFLHVLTTLSAAIVPRSETTRLGRQFATHPVGTGPFVVKTWTRGARIRMVRNPYYFKADRPGPDAVDVLVGLDRSTQAMMFERGELDFEYYITDPDLTRFRRDPRMKACLKRVVGSTPTFAFLNCEIPPFTNRLVRVALNHAIDREAAVRLMSNRAVAQRGPLPLTVRGFNQELPEYAYDPARARALLAEAGYPNGFATTLWCNPKDPTWWRLGLFVQESLRKVGVSVSMREISYTGLIDASGRRRTVPMGIWDWVSAYDDPRDTLDSLLNGNNLSEDGCINNAFYSAPRVDELFRKSAAEGDPGRRLSLFRQIERQDRKSTRLNSSHIPLSRMPSSA